jgi:tRNA (cytosine34-C5)-methyltransferase
VEATGAVVANDVDPQRAFHLVRRCAALGEPCTRLMVTCHPGQRYPNPSCVGSPLVHTAPSTTATAVEKEGRYAAGCYDRIICDVPCSGDGTLRKIPEAWKQWHPDYGIKLHSLQLSIALRGLALLRVGGIMCYSTCTFNPIEDEAVVGELLRVCGGAVELMDATTRLPQVPPALPRTHRPYYTAATAPILYLRLQRYERVIGV